MKTFTRTPGMLAIGLALIVLTGCEAAEQSAQKLLDETVEKTTEAALKVMDEAVGDAVEQINEQVDGAQDRVNQTLGKPDETEPGTQQATDDTQEDIKNRG